MKELTPEELSKNIKLKTKRLQLAEELLVLGDDDVEFKRIMKELKELEKELNN